MEIAGVIVFASLMGTVAIQLMVEGIRSLISGSHSSTFSWLATAFVAFALGSFKNRKRTSPGLMFISPVQIKKKKEKEPNKNLPL